MKCRHYFSFVLVAFLSFFFGSFIITSNTFAVDDLSYTFDFSDIPAWYDICQSSSDCSSYSYLIVDPLNPSSCQNPSIFYVAGIASYNTGVSVCSSSIYPLSSSSNIYLTGGHSGTYVGSVTLILSETLGSLPSGDISITSNGTYDVSSYATATVDVPAEAVPGDYHDDLVNINYSIIVCGAILLVLYFFYCIYRLIIKNSGVH